MELVKCDDCGGAIEIYGEPCPHCGAIVVYKLIEERGDVEQYIRRELGNPKRELTKEDLDSVLHFDMSNYYEGEDNPPDDWPIDLSLISKLTKLQHLRSLLEPFY